jgi:hypothetical protein
MQTRTRTELAAVWPPNVGAAREVGHERQSALRAIRAKCLDCSAGSSAEVRRCEAVKCPLWPFRAGRHPWIAVREKPPSGAGGCGQGPPFQKRPGVRL